jgi:lantibiotic transport system permease protein
MSLLLSLRSEILKTRRTASFWLSVIGAFFIPAMFFLVYAFKPVSSLKHLKFAPWAIHFAQGWQYLNAFLFPMYIILVCALIPQIEFKNNTWKQVFASPQSTGSIYFSKFLTIHIMILFSYILFNFFMITTALGVNLIHKNFPFIEQHIDWKGLMRLNLKTYISILGISAIQFWLGLRFKNFIAPVGIGLALLIGSIIATGMQWEHVAKIPYAHPVLTLRAMMTGHSRGMQDHDWYSIGYFVVFTLLGFFDLNYRKEKG